MLLYHLDKLKYCPVMRVAYSVNYTSNQRILDGDGVFDRGQTSHCNNDYSYLLFELLLFILL